MDRSTLPLEQQIEYYLGKDRLPNLHWKPEIPESWTIPPRAGSLLCDYNTRGKSRFLDNIQYKFNQLGYRSDFEYHVDTLKKKDLILLLGDSDTAGRGVEFVDLYSTKIRKLTNHYVINLGVAGISGDGMTRIGVQTIMALGSSVKHVCVLWPVLSTREFVSKKFCHGVCRDGNYLPYDNWWDHIDWVSNNYNYQKNRLLIEQTTKNYGAQYHDLIINRYDKTTPTTYNSIQDNELTEFTPESHTAIANYFLRKINNRPSLFEQLKTQS
jgi:hypothetical protein